MKPHVIIAAGGSGGHVLPAQIVAQQLRQAGVLASFAAGGIATNPFVDGEARTCHEISASPFSLSPSFFTTTVRGIVQSSRLMRCAKPALVVGFGSYHSVPVLAAALLLRIPIVLYAADAIPGRAIRLFAPFAKWTGCFFKEAASHLRGEVCHVSFPIRPALQDLPSKDEGCRYFGLDSSLPTVLVFGGSQGAKALNILVPSAIACLPLRPAVIHLAGQEADLSRIQASYDTYAIPACVRGYESAMQYAYAAADVVIARAGASTIAEIEACHKKAIYIPYPRAMDAHQIMNAQLAAARGRAVVLEERTAMPEVVAQHLYALLEPSPQTGHDHQSSSLSFATKLLQTLDEVSVCQKR